LCTVVNSGSGTACPDDGNPCTNDICDGGGTCTHPAKPGGTSCGGGNVCYETNCVLNCDWYCWGVAGQKYNCGTGTKCCDGDTGSCHGCFLNSQSCP
jgi:hypothetical protein